MPSYGRVHLVLVPGFAGFDALGQIEYFAGITPVCREWQRRIREPRVVLHYFDTFPTAGVAHRARRLAAFLAKRVLRGEFQPGDDVVLVGHSTGGLDIRQMILDLAGEPAPLLLDGLVDPALAVTNIEVLGAIRRVVFLSVPQRGTNIADWVAARPIERKALVAQLRASVASSSDLPLVGRLEAAVAGSTAVLSGAEIFCAIEDALAEITPDRDGASDQAAYGREAGADLALWLHHMWHDFSAIDDLSVVPQPDGIRSPAHASEEERESERQLWEELHIQTRSYATLGPRVREFSPGQRAPSWNPLFEPVLAPVGATDFVYRATWRACAGGPFTPDRSLPVGIGLDSSEFERVEPWDNDGIVNTASMLWPDGAETRLVHADHMDVVGHFELAPAPAGGPRRYRAYDLLGSGAQFDHDAFERLWSEVFEFCADVGAGAGAGRNRTRT